MPEATLFLLIALALASILGFASPALAQFSAPYAPAAPPGYSAPQAVMGGGQYLPGQGPPGQTAFPAQPAYQQPGLAVSPEGVPMGVVVPMGGGNSAIVSPDGQPIGVTQ